MAEIKIPFKKLPVGQREIAAVRQVIEAKALSSGRWVEQLEERFADYVGCKYAIGVNSCSSALFLSVYYKKQEVANYYPCVIPSMTVPLVCNSIVNAGVPVSFADDIDWVGKSYDLAFYGVVDSAHEVSKSRPFKVGELICYSFYPTKPICSCEGGMICTNDSEAAEWL